MISKFSVKKVYTVFVAVVLVIVLGVVSFTKMSADLLPSINLPYIIVMTTYVGASPETVEMVVTKPVESSMATVSNIEDITSVSAENYSMVILGFTQSANMDSASLEIRENLDQIKSYWDDDAIGNTIIMKLNPDMLPIMTAAVGEKGMTNAEISELAKNKIMPELESIEGVASASATGLISESVHVVIRQDKIDAINEKVFGSIDKEMEDAEQKLRDSNQDIMDNENDIAENEQDIAENIKDLEDAKKDLADGKRELSEKEEELKEGKEKLKDTKKETAEKLSEAMTGLLTAKSSLSTMNVNIQMLEMTIVGTMSAISPDVKTVEEAQDRYQTLNNYAGQSSYSTEDKDDIEAKFSKIVAPLISSMEGEHLSDISDIPAGVLGSDHPGVIMDEVINNALNEAKDEIDANVNISSKVVEYQGMVIAKQKFFEELNKMPDIKIASEKDLDDAITKLSKGQIEAAAGFGSADAGMIFGEAQIESGKKQMESAEDQLTSGQEQIDKAKEQIDKAKEQIADAKEQLEDAREQLDDSKTQAYNSADMNGILTVENVKSLLAAQNFSMPAGYVKEDGNQYLVRVGDKPDDVETLSAMPIMNVNMDDVDVITLSDVADVFMTDNSDEIYTNVNGVPGVLLQIQKQTGYSTGDVSDKINAKFEELSAEDENLILMPLMDQGIYIDLVMDSILNNILVGAALAILILILFLKDLRPTFIIAVSIPISIITAIVCMYFSGVTLNIISLSGLALGIGMLVDNSIVVIENIYRMRNEGASMRDAAIEGSKEVAGAITSSTLTTICVFAPIVFTEGITRQLFVDMGLTIAYSLVASLVIALTVVPAMASRVLKKTKEQKESGFFAKLSGGYEKLLHLAVRFKAVVLILAVGLLALSGYLAMQRGTAFIPQMDSTQLTVNIEMPKGTPLSESGKTTDEIVERIRSIEEVKDVGAMTETSDLGMLGGGDSSDVTNRMQAFVVLKDDKNHSAKEVGDMIMEKTKDINAILTVNTDSFDMGAMGGSGVSIQVRGRDTDTLQKIAKDVAKIVENTEGTENVSDGMEDTTGELRIKINRDKAMDYGLTVAQVFAQINEKIKDDTSSTELTTDTKEYDIYVIHQANENLIREDIKNMMIDYTDKDKLKQEIALSEIAEFDNHEGLNAINRDDQTRYIGVTAEIKEGYNVGLVSAKVKENLSDYKLPNGYTLKSTGEDETINEAMEQLALMLLLALILMYLIMVAQFQSLLSPFIIMFTIPLAFTGGLFGLYFGKNEISVTAVIGFVMLSGIIVNNGIVLVDYINQLCESGMEKKEAIYRAGRTRLRPVLMTALTTILALSTMVFSQEMGSDMAKPMAIVTTGGLVYGTLLTLFVIPCIYDVFHPQKKHKKEVIIDKGERGITKDGEKDIKGRKEDR